MEDYMHRALRLAEKARGRTEPNPMVGAVLVREGRVVGEGYHHRAGEPHAEVLALRQAGEAARGATLYVTLEPCCHFGRTPPCTRALVAAGVARVHMAMLDPNPRVAGQGRDELEAAGIPTIVGEHEQEARTLNEAFVHWIRRGTPFVIAKYAMSLDGKTATRTGASQWITAAEARLHTHHLRDQVGAILVGANTVVLDNPQLTTRLPKTDVHHPLRVIVDSRGRVPISARVFDPTLPGKTLLATTHATPEKHRKALSARGIEVLVLPSDLAGDSIQRARISLPALLEALGRREVSSMLIDGGATVLGAFFEQGLVNKVMAYIAPIVIGGHDAPGAVGGLGIEHIEQAVQLQRLSVERLGRDLLVSGYPARKEDSSV